LMVRLVGSRVCQNAMRAASASGILISFFVARQNAVSQRVLAT